MVKIKSFEELLSICPIDIIEKLEELKTLKERKDFHPEGNTYEHIRIVTERLMKTDNINLILAGLFHDICKLDAAKFNYESKIDISEKDFEILKAEADTKTYGHEFLAKKYIIDNHITFIESLGGSVESIIEIVVHHMKIKQMDNMRDFKKEEIKKLKNYKELLIFKEADNMLKLFNYENSR